MPSNAVIRACARANRDGFGLCTPTKFFKSLDYEEFKSELDKVGKEENCILHFRLATHGSVCKANCHPFKKKDVYFAHNGVLDITPIGNKTDSETAFIKYIYPQIAKHGLCSVQTELAVQEVIGYSKFAIMQGEKISLYGNYEKVKGVYYSNLRFLHYM